MMRQVLYQLKCPQCSHVNLKVAETIINPNIEANLKRQILNDEFFMVQCRCGYKINFLYPCIYVDKKQHLILFMKEAEALHEERCIQRLVHDAEQFKEVIRIVDACLDDRAIAIIKHQLMVRNGLRQCYFLDCDLWFICDGKMSGIKQKNYDKIAATLTAPTIELIDVDAL